MSTNFQTIFNFSKLSELFSKQFCSLSIVCLFLFLLSGTFTKVQAENPELNFHQWWTSNELHLIVSMEGEMPPPSQNQATYFLTFKNKWVVEVEGIINSRLKKHSLQVGSVTAGESSNGQKHHLSMHIILKQVKLDQRHKECNVMAFIYTTTSEKKDLKKACTDKINKELVSFKKSWKLIHSFWGEVENKGSSQTHRTRWQGVVGVKE